MKSCLKKNTTSFDEKEEGELDWACPEGNGLPPPSKPFSFEIMVEGEEKRERI